MSGTRAHRTRNLRYKRPALASMGFEVLQNELWEIGEACNDVRWFLAFSDLEAKAEELERIINDCFRWDNEGFARTYNDCTVALVGDRYRLVGYEFMEEDYFALTAFEEGLAQTEAGKRLMRMTKAEMLSTIGQCFGLLLAFLDLRQQYDYLKAAFDILRDENTSLLRQIREIDTAYEAADKAEWYGWLAQVKRFDQLLDCLPDRAWIE